MRDAEPALVVMTCRLATAPRPGGGRDIDRFQRLSVKFAAVARSSCGCVVVTTRGCHSV